MSSGRRGRAPCRSGGFGTTCSRARRQRVVVLQAKSREVVEEVAIDERKVYRPPRAEQRAHDPPTMLELVEKAYALAFAPGEYDRFAQAWTAYADQHPDDRDAQLGRNLEQAIRIIESNPGLNDPPRAADDIVAREASPAAVIDRGLQEIAGNAHWRSQHATSKRRDEFLRSLRRSIVKVCVGIDPGPQFAFTRYDRAELVSVSRVIVNEPVEKTLAMVRMMRIDWSDALDEILVDCFRLTPSELQTARRLIREGSLAEIAATRMRSEETIRSQVKSIYRKLDVSGRVGFTQFLMQLLILMERTGGSRTPSADAATTTAGARVYVATSSGEVSFVERGNPDGTPLVFLHGMASGHGFLPAADEALHQAKVRLICVERSGYGHSTPARDWDAIVDHFLEGFAAVLEHLGVARLPIVSHTTGVLYAVAAASRGYATRVLATAGGVPVQDRSRLNEYPVRVRALAIASQRLPVVLRLLVAAGVRKMRNEPGARFLGVPYRERAADRNAMRDPEIAAQLRAGYDLADCHGFDGFCGDAVHVFGDWSSWFDGLQVPITYLNGDDDEICPARWALSFAQNQERVSVAVLRGAGQLMQHSHWPAYVAALTAFADDRPLAHPDIDWLLAPQNPV